MPHDYVPRPDADFLIWVNQLTNTLSAEQEAYGLPQAMLDLLIPANQAFTDAMAALTPGMRCLSYVQRKNDARRVVEKIARRCVRWVGSQPGTTDAMKNAIRISLRGRGGFNGRRKRPAAAPGVMVRKIDGPAVTVWVIDRENGRNTRPHGVKSAQLFVAVGEQIDEESRWQFMGACSVSKTIDLSPLGLRPGERVWVRACWHNTHGPGPAGDPVATRVADGFVLPRLAA